MKYADVFECISGVGANPSLPCSFSIKSLLTNLLQQKCLLRYKTKTCIEILSHI